MAQNNNQRDQYPQANTQGLYVPNWQARLLLQVKYFEKMLSINLHVAIDSPGNEALKFEQKETAVAYLKTSHAKAFYKQAKKSMRKFDETGVFESVGVELKKSFIELATAGDLKERVSRFDVDLDPNTICLAIHHVEESDTNRSSKSFMIYPFPYTTTFSNYNPDSGKRDTQVVQAEVWEFIDSLNDWSRAMSNGIVHAQKNDSKYERRRHERMITEISNHLGIDLGSAIKRGTGNNSNNPYAGGGGNRNGSYTKDSSSTSTGGQSSTQYVTTNNSEEDIDSVIANMRSAAASTSDGYDD